MKMVTALILGLLLAIFGVLTPSILASPYRNSLRSGESLNAFEALSYMSFLFIMQPNCNLVLYVNSTALWSTNTDGYDYGCYATLQFGDLVVYRPNAVPLWQSGNKTTGGQYVMVLQKNGEIVIYGTPNWYIGFNQVAPNTTAPPLEGNEEATLLSGMPEPNLEGNEEATLLSGMPKATLLSGMPEPTLEGNEEATLLSGMPEPTLEGNEEATLLTGMPEPTNVTDTDESLPWEHNVLYYWETLTTGESLTCETYRCTIQTDCDFACWNDTELIWSTGTSGKGIGCFLKFPIEGLIEIYDNSNALVYRQPYHWRESNFILIVQKYPIIGIFGPPIWSTNWGNLTRHSTAQPNNQKISMVTGK